MILIELTTDIVS